MRIIEIGPPTIAREDMLKAAALVIRGFGDQAEFTAFDQACRFRDVGNYCAGINWFWIAATIADLNRPSAPSDTLN